MHGVDLQKVNGTAVDAHTAIVLNSMAVVAGSFDTGSLFKCLDW